MKLYGSLTSPYVRKVRIVLAEKGIPYEFVVENPSDPGTRIPALNPLGKVPAFERDNGKVLYDSALIVEYLDALQGEPLIPPAGEARWDVLLWHTLAMGIVDAVVARLMETRRPSERQSPQVIARQEGKIARGLAAADATEKGARYLVGDSLTLADISLGVALEYIDLRYPHAWRAQYPHLAQWLDRFSNRDSFIATRPPA